MQIRPTAITIGLIIYSFVALFYVYTEFGIDSPEISLAAASCIQVGNEAACYSDKSCWPIRPTKIGTVHRKLLQCGRNKTAYRMYKGWSTAHCHRILSVERDTIQHMIGGTSASVGFVEVINLKHSFFLPFISIWQSTPERRAFIICIVFNADKTFTMTNQ